ncbi:MAG: M67 family metallopeptidase [Spirochaetes bacterium]|nr:M67 family metallopeptidase [Spirochaetota bacterium]
MLTISRVALEAFIQRARDEAPIESCAYFAGSDGIVKEMIPMTNIDKSAEHFSFDPKEQFAAVRTARSKNLTLLAVCHSHPASPARMSAEDIRLANDPSMRYIIHSLSDNVTRCFAYGNNNTIVEEDIHIIAEERR